MRLERSKNAKRNSFWGLISNMVATLFPFFVRTILIKELGAEYLGLSGLFTSILTVLNITELGFGTAMVYTMYKPLADDDTDLLCALLNFYRKIYKIIGILIFVAGLAVMPFLKNLINGTVPNGINIYVLYVMYLVNTSLSYWLLAYKNSILVIYQRDDITSRIGIIAMTAMYIGQAIVIATTHNYYFYVAALLCYTAGKNIFPAIYVKRHYPQYSCRGEISQDLKKDIKTRVSGLMITKLSSVSRNAFDSIVVSAFFGLVIVGIYNNYFYIINAVTSIMLVFTSAIAGGVGNSVAEDTPEKNRKDFRIINFWYMWISAWFMSCLVGLFQPFMRLWVGNDLMFSNRIMIAFALYFFIQKLGEVQAKYFDAVGLWWHRKWYSIAEAIGNLLLNVILGYFFGVFGIVVATIITIFFINFLGASRIIFRYYFKTGFREYIFDQLRWLLIACGISAIIYVVTSNIRLENAFAEIFIKALICAVVPNILIFLLNFKTKLYPVALQWISVRVKRKS